MNIRIYSSSLEITDNIRALVIKKLNDSFRALGQIDRDAVNVSFELEQTHNHLANEKGVMPQYSAKLHVSMPGSTIHLDESGANIMKAVARLKQKLTRELRHRREKMIDGRRQRARAFKRKMAK